MNVGARPAGDDDVARISDLARLAIDEVADQKGGGLWRRRSARPEPVAPTIAADVDATDTCVLAGTIDRAVVGYAVAAIESLGDGGRLAIVSDIFVEPPAREVGVGSALMEDIVAWATAEGCVGIDATALPGARATKNFFEAHHLVARSITVHRALGGDSP